MTENNNRRKVLNKKIFISWSGEISKKIAIQLKYTLEKEIFEGTGLTCFVSTVDISSGTDWWNKIKKELRQCHYAILCITKDNITAPWIYFEAGATTAKEIPTVPLLINCDANILASTPLKGNQAIIFNEPESFKKMIKNVNDKFDLISISEKNLKKISANALDELQKSLTSELKLLKDTRKFNAMYVYPRKVQTIKKNTLYLSTSMSDLDEKDYNELYEYSHDLKNILIKDFNFTQVTGPILDIKTKEDFEGSTKAITDNFKILKEVESMIVIYPQYKPSSVLLEVGYGLALSKRMVIFYKDKLPYMLEDAGETIANITTRKYKTYQDVSKYLTKNGPAIFRRDLDD